MKYKKILLVASVLALFVVQQARVSAEKGDAPIASPLLGPGYTPPTTVKVTYYRLNDGINETPKGVLYLDPTTHNPEVCSPITTKGGITYYNDHYGCTEKNNGGSGWAYPYLKNPYDDPVETDYLLNVLSHEMDPHTYPNPQSEMAQAVASRTYVYWKDRYRINITNFGDDNGLNDPSRPDSQVDIPYAFDYWLNYPSTGHFAEPYATTLCQSTGLTATEVDVCNAVTATQGYYLSQSGLPIDTEFRDDAGGITADGGTSYLKSVQDPISTTCGAAPNYSGPGMSQKGANRWELGNQCASGGSASTSWIVRWSDYRQILAHYYTGVDLTSPAPSDRWNLLNFNNNTPLLMNAGATNTYSVMLQNTSTTTWAQNDIVLGYQWTPVNGKPQSGNWQAKGSLPSVQAGGSVSVPVPITAPTTPGVYTLHLDVRHSNSNSWFSFGGWPDAKVSTGCVGAVCTQIIQGSDDAGTNPSNPCYFSPTDNEVYLGACLNGGNITSGFRFQNLPIPQAAHIQSAYIVFTVDGPYMDSISVLIDGELSTNAATYSQSDQPTDPSRQLTGSPVRWDITDTWNLGEIRNTPDLSTVIQSIVNQTSWVNGNNALSIIIKNNSSTSVRRVIAYERARLDPNLLPAILVIVYTP